MPKKKKPKPETELRLEALQDKFLNDPNDTDVYHEYFNLLKVYARSLTLKEIKNKVFLPPDRVEEVAVEATVKLIHQYRKDTWKVWGSFGGALRWKIVEALYQDSDEESAQSLNTLIGDSSQELGDIMTKIGASPVMSYVHAVQDPSETALLEKAGLTEVQAVLGDAREVLPYRTYFTLLIYVLHTFRRSKARHAIQGFRDLYMNNSQTASVFDAVLLEIRQRLLEYA